jgi:hypothetical protein
MTEGQRLKDCFGEETMISYSLSKPADNLFVENIRKLFPVELFREFPRPFFRCSVPGHFLLTGVIGLDKIKITFRKECPFRDKDLLEDIINYYH